MILTFKVAVSKGQDESKPKLNAETCAGDVSRLSKQLRFLDFQINQKTKIGKDLIGCTFELKTQFFKQLRTVSPTQRF